MANDSELALRHLIVEMKLDSVTRARLENLINANNEIHYKRGQRDKVNYYEGNVEHHVARAVQKHFEKYAKINLKLLQSNPAEILAPCASKDTQSSSASTQA